MRRKEEEEGRKLKVAGRQTLAHCPWTLPKRNNTKDMLIYVDKLEVIRQ